MAFLKLHLNCFVRGCGSYICCCSSQTVTQPDHDKLSTVTVHDLNFSSAFGGRIQQPLAVVLVATHADLADVPRAFSGEFSYDKERALLKEVRNR